MTTSEQKDPAAYTPQPARDGPDYWPTIDPHLILALVHRVLPALRARAPAGLIWECAAGAGHLVDPMRQAGREVIATDLYPQRPDIARHDFVHDDPPAAALGSCAVTNAPGNQLDAFIARGLQLFDSRRIAGLVLLLRLDHLQADECVEALNRAIWEVHCNWRAVWIAGTKGNPGRFSSHWILWRRGRRRAPLYLRESDLTQGRLIIAPSNRRRPPHG